jgi:hypothetical protein
VPPRLSKHSNSRPGQQRFFAGVATAASNRVYTPSGLHTSRGSSSGTPLADTGCPPVRSQHVHCLCLGSSSGASSRHMNGAVIVMASAPKCDAAQAAVALRPQDKKENVLFTPSSASGSKEWDTKGKAVMVRPSLAQRKRVSEDTQSPFPATRPNVNKKAQHDASQIN